MDPLLPVGWFRVQGLGSFEGLGYYVISGLKFSDEMGKKKEDGIETATLFRVKGY